jgi:hypothetical protein
LSFFLNSIIGLRAVHTRREGNDEKDKKTQNFISAILVLSKMHLPAIESENPLL